MSVTGRSLVSLERRRWLLSASLLIVLVLVGCRGPTDLLSSGLPDDGLPAAASREAAQRLIDNVTAAAQSAATTGHFSLSITEEEATSALTFYGGMLERFQVPPTEGSEQIEVIPDTEGVDRDGWGELLSWRDRLPMGGEDGTLLGLELEDPAVYFQGNGQLIVRGRIRLAVGRFPFRVVAAPHAAHGDLVLDFVEGRIGPFPMPHIVFDYLARGLARAVGAGQDYVEITEILVSNGVMTVGGQWKR